MLDCIASIFKLKLTAPQKKAIEKQDGQGHVDRIFFCSWLKSFLAIPLEVNHIWELIRQNIGRFVTLDIHAEMILSQAQMEYELVLLTNGGIENQNRKITQTKLNRFFTKDRIFISEAIGYQKPNLKIFQWVANQFDENRSFVMIGNHWENDILGAQQFGWKAVYINSEKQDSKTENVKIISSLLSLNKALNELECVN